MQQRLGKNRVSISMEAVNRNDTLHHLILHSRSGVQLKFLDTSGPAEILNNVCLKYYQSQIDEKMCWIYNTNVGGVRLKKQSQHIKLIKIQTWKCLVSCSVQIEHYCLQIVVDPLPIYIQALNVNFFSIIHTYEQFV